MSKLLTSSPDYNLLVADEKAEVLRTKDPVGYIVLAPNVFLQVPKKPNWFRRIMMYLLLGWKYVPLNAEGRTRQLLYG